MLILYTCTSRGQQSQLNNLPGLQSTPICYKRSTVCMFIKAVHFRIEHCRNMSSIGPTQLGKTLQKKQFNLNVDFLFSLISVLQQSPLLRTVNRRRRMYYHRMRRGVRSCTLPGIYLRGCRTWASRRKKEQRKRLLQERPHHKYLQNHFTS